MGEHRAVFLDRDGTINLDPGYLSDPEQLRLLPGAAEAVRELNERGLRTIVITNQSGIARGFYTEQQLGRIHERLAELLQERGARIDAFYYCPHHVEGKVAPYNTPCDCRKPSPGLLLKAAAEHNVDLSASTMIGNAASDIVVGARAGCRTVLISTDAIDPDACAPDHVAADLLEAARIVLAEP